MNRTQIIGNELLTRGRDFFSLAQIVEATGFDRTVVRDTLLTLHSEGFLRRIHRTLEPYDKAKGPPMVNIRYRVIVPAKLAAKIAPRHRGENNLCDKIWFVIRKKKSFTRRDLRVLTGASSATVRWFTKMLHRMGIIIPAARGEWSLIKDPGARRPYVGDVIKRKKAAARNKSKSDCLDRL